MVQELRFIDKSIFRGEVFLDEETHLVYKEGVGFIDRASGKDNLCFYNRISGSWSRGILHGKRIQFDMNLDVFPKGYF